MAYTTYLSYGPTRRKAIATAESLGAALAALAHSVKAAGNEVIACDQDVENDAADIAVATPFDIDLYQIEPTR